MSSALMRQKRLEGFLLAYNRHQPVFPLPVNVAIDSESLYVNGHWLGGILTNASQSNKYLSIKAITIREESNLSGRHLKIRHIKRRTY